MKKRGYFILTIAAWIIVLITVLLQAHIIKMDNDNFQTYANIILMILAIIELAVTLNDKHKQKSSQNKDENRNIREKQILANVLIPIAAYVMNAKIFDERIRYLSDIFGNIWHTLWFIVLLIQSLTTTNLGSCIIGEAIALGNWAKKCAVGAVEWLGREITSANRAVLWAGVLGCVSWFVLPHPDTEEILDWSFQFWVEWILLCFLISCMVEVFKERSFEGAEKGTRQNIKKAILIIAITAVCVLCRNVQNEVKKVLLATTAAVLIARNTTAARVFTKKKEHLWGMEIKDIVTIFLLFFISFCMVVGIGALQGDEVITEENSLQWIELFAAGLDIIEKILTLSNY